MLLVPIINYRYAMRLFINNYLRNNIMSFSGFYGEMMGMISTKCDETSYQIDSMCALANALCFHNYQKFKTLNYYSI